MVRYISIKFEFDQIYSVGEEEICFPLYTHKGTQTDTLTMKVTHSFILLMIGEERYLISLYITATSLNVEPLTSGITIITTSTIFFSQNWDKN